LVPFFRQGFVFLFVYPILDSYEHRKKNEYEERERERKKNKGNASLSYIEMFECCV